MKLICEHTGITAGSENCRLCRIHGCEGYKIYHREHKKKASSAKEWLMNKKENIMYVINQNGERIQLNNYDGEWLYEKAAIVDDDVELEDIWIMELSTGNDRSRENFEIEFVTDILFTHEPTKDEILRAMVVHGLSIHRDVAIVRHGYRIR